MVGLAPADGSNIFWNQRWYDYTGLTPAESEGFDWMQAVHPEHRDQCAEFFRQAVASGAEWSNEAPVRRAADGQYRWHFGRGLPIRDADGRIVRWMGICVDIHDRREAEQALRESEQRYRALIEVSPQMVWLARADGSNIFWNQRWYDYTGLTPAESEGFDWMQAVHPEHRDQCAEFFRQALASGAAWSNEAPVRRAADGQYRWHFGRGLPIRDADGRIVRWMGICVDIHDRREAEQALRESEQRYRTLIEVSPQMVWVARADGSNIFWNQRWYDYTGLTPAESEGFGWMQAVHPEHRDQCAQFFRQALASGGEWSSEAPVRRAAGGQRRQ